MLKKNIKNRISNFLNTFMPVPLMILKIINILKI